MENLPEYIVKALHKVARNEGLFDYTMDFAAGSKHGDNFVGIATAIKILGFCEINGEKTKKNLNLFCKSAPESEERRSVYNTVELFKRENLMYTEVLPALLAFQKEKGLSEEELFQSFPKCYLSVADTDNNEFLLILENLRPKGFEMRPRDKPMSLEHLQLLMEELGKLHGISFALKDQKPELFDKFKKLNDLLLSSLEKPFKPTFEMAFDFSIELLKSSEHRKLLEQAKKNIFEIIENCLNGDNTDRFYAVTHGDCWNNNLLFRCEENKAKDIILLDWQVSRYCSPAADIFYFVLSATDKQLRDKHWKQLIGLYYSSLANMIKNLGSDPDKLFTFADLNAELKRFGEFGLVWGTIFTTFAFINPENILDPDEFSSAAKEPEKKSILNGIDNSRKDEYMDAINSLIGDIIDYGYVDLKKKTDVC